MGNNLSTFTHIYTCMAVFTVKQKRIETFTIRLQDHEAVLDLSQNLFIGLKVLKSKEYYTCSLL